jgi:RHS repeat-associated protein
MSGTSPANDDLLTGMLSDASGNVVDEYSYGGKAANLAVTALCTMGLPSAAVFRTAHAYDYGTRARTWSIDPVTDTAASFWTQNDVIDPTGLVAASYDSAGLGTYFTYDNMGRLRTATPPGGEVPTTYTYTNAAATAPAKVTIFRDGGPGKKPEAEFQFDSLGRVALERTRTAADTFSLRKTDYDQVGQAVNVSEWDTAVSSNGTATTYDVLGRPLTVKTADLKTTSFVYSGNKSVVRSASIRTNARLGETLQSTTELYDRFGRLTTVREGSGDNGAPVDTKYTYDVGNRLATATTALPVVTQGVPPPEQTRTFTYDNRGLLRSTTSPEKQAAVQYLDHDARGHARRIVEGALDLTYTYDANERLTKIAQTGGATVKTFTFGTDNVPPACTDACTGFTNGKLMTAVRIQIDPALGGVVTVTESYDYNHPSGRVSDRHTAVSSTPSLAAATFSISQEYDPFGAAKVIGYPSCAEATPCFAATPAARPSNGARYEYTNGWLTKISSDASDYASVTYQPNGLIDTLDHANHVKETWIGDLKGMARPCAIFATGLGTHLQTDNAAPCKKAIALDSGSAAGVQWTTGAYAYDGAGNIRQIGGKQYVYDPVSRLVRETDSGTVANSSYSYSTDYKYDRFGNMLQQSFVRQASSTPVGDGSAGDGSVTRATTPIAVDSSTNRLQYASYDATGNMTANGDPDRPASYTWDAIGTMRSLIEPERELHFLYTADDERVAVVSLPTASPASKALTTWTLRGFSSQLLRTLVEDRSVTPHLWSWTGDEIWRGSSLLADVTPAGTRHFILDHLGSPRLITDSSGTAHPVANDFSAFGSGGSTGSGPLQFTGHERDWGTDAPRSLDYMHARYYSAGVGRFLSVDPVTDVKTTPHNPQGWSRYTYVRDNPTRFTDPAGKYTCSGSKDDCRAIDTAVAYLTAAASKLPKDSSDRNRLNNVIVFLGAANTDNGVHISIGSGTITGAAGGTLTRNGITAIGIDLKADSAYASAHNVTQGAELAGTLTHEAQHGLEERRHGNPESRAQEKSAELAAYTTEAGTWRGMGISAPTHIWTTGTGFNPRAVEAWSETATQIWCKEPGAPCN